MSEQCQRNSRSIQRHDLVKVCPWHLTHVHVRHFKYMCSIWLGLWRPVEKGEAKFKFGGFHTVMPAVGASSGTLHIVIPYLWCKVSRHRQPCLVFPLSRATCPPV